MGRSEKLFRYLRHSRMPYELIKQPHTNSLQQAARCAGIDESSVARGVLLSDGRDYVQVVLPLNQVIDFRSLEKVTDRKLEPVANELYQKIFEGCEAGTNPPLGPAFGLQTIADRSLLVNSDVYFEPGCHDLLVKMTVADFQSMLGNVVWSEVSGSANDLSQPAGTVFEDEGSYCHENNVKDYLPAADLRNRLSKLYTLPTIPSLALEILQISRSEDSTADDLAGVVERDPNMSAQVMRYARSPFFASNATVETIRDSIHKVLGFDMVANICLGLSAAKSFRNPPDGPLGLNAFWQHSTYSASLCQMMAKAAPKTMKINPGLAYLSGLLHNFGYLVLGYMFKPEFYLLNKLVMANPTTPVSELEKQVLAFGEAQQIIHMGHAKLGAWIMHNWNMPETVLACVSEHHNTTYEKEHAEYVGLVTLADRLLKRIELGDGDSTELPADLLAKFGFTEEQLEGMLESLQEKSECLDSMAQQLAA